MGADVTTGGDNRRLSNLVAVSVVIPTGTSSRSPSFSTNTSDCRSRTKRRGFAWTAASTPNPCRTPDLEPKYLPAGCR